MRLEEFASPILKFRKKKKKNELKEVTTRRTFESLKFEFLKKFYNLEE